MTGYLWPPLVGWLLIFPFLSLTCGGGIEEDPVKKKSMEDLYYAYEVDSVSIEQADTSLTSILKVYSLNPEIFGDPVRIITEFEDSLSLIPKNRRPALVVTDPTAELPAGVKMAEVTGGNVLAYSCRGSKGGIDSCWSRIGAFAKGKGYTCLPPGIELFREFGAESYSDTSIVELIVRIK